MQTSNCGVSYQTFPPNKMDYHKKMIVTPAEQKVKIEEDDDEDLEALRLAALQSLRTKETINKKPLPHSQPVISHITQTSRFPYKNQRRGRGAFYHNRSHPRQAQNYNHPYQNGNVYYQSPRNPNLIAIVPVEEETVPRQTELPCSVKIEKTDPCSDTKSPETTKFHRFNDNGSGSDDEDVKDQKNTTEDAGKTEPAGTIKTETDKDIVVEENVEKMEQQEEEEEEEGEEEEEEDEEEEDSQKNQEDDVEDNDDDADVLLMADLEEEDSLERLMDEMEREMNVDKPSEQKQAKASRKEHRESRKYNEKSLKNQEQKIKTDEVSNKKLTNSSASLTSAVKSERRSISPHKINTLQQRRRSLSPKIRSRKKSPRRSPRRSPSRQAKKQPRDTTRYKSPRKSPPRYLTRPRSPRLSPRSRSPRLSPRRSPNRSPIRRSPLRKLSPRGRSPRLSPHTRSPKRLRSRTPPVMTRSKSPRPPRSPKVLSRSRSPRLRSRSPRYSPIRRSRSKSPRGSPRRGTPPRRLSPRRSPPSRRLSPRLRSPALSPRRTSPRGRSPKLSPRRVSPRLRSPRPSPRRSPWSSPRNSPRLSPRRKRSPQWSPKELSRKRTTRSISPAPSNLFARDNSPVVKGKSSPETSRQKIKQREEQPPRNTPIENTKEHVEITNNPILEARRKKFECTKPIDLVLANKKIKLSKKENVKKAESVEDTDLTSNNPKRSGKPTEDYDAQETDLCLDVNYEFEDLDDSMENTSPVGIPTTVSMEVEPPKADKEKKKKRKRDKEIYQVGKLKGELPLSERIGKEKKATKRKDVSETSSEDVEAIFEDLAVDEEGDLRTELSRRRAERLHRTVPLQSARLVQSAFKGVVNEVVKNNAKVNQRHIIKSDDKSNQKGIRRVTVLHRTVSDLHDSEDESAVDSKVPVRFRLGLNKQVQETRESKVSRKASKRQGRKVKHKNLSSDPQHTL